MIMIIILILVSIILIISMIIFLQRHGKDLDLDGVFEGNDGDVDHHHHQDHLDHHDHNHDQGGDLDLDGVVESNVAVIGATRVDSRAAVKRVKAMISNYS